MEYINDLVEELSDKSKYSHAVFGCFGGEFGHYIKKFVGVPIIKRYAYNESEYCTLFEYERDGPEFKAKVHSEKIPEGFKLKLIFNDRRGDHRGGSHTDYVLLIPEKESERIVPLIRRDYSILIKLFQRVFPDYDRSSGKLVLDNIHKSSEH